MDRNTFRLRPRCLAPKPLVAPPLLTPQPRCCALNTPSRDHTDPPGPRCTLTQQPAQHPQHAKTREAICCARGEPPVAPPQLGTTAPKPRTTLRFLGTHLKEPAAPQHTPLHRRCVTHTKTDSQICSGPPAAHPKASLSHTLLPLRCTRRTAACTRRSPVPQQLLSAQLLQHKKRNPHTAPHPTIRSGLLPSLRNAALAGRIP
jgi:hypothetical protein